MARDDRDKASRTPALYTRDQRRALHAYNDVAKVKDNRNDYKIAINDLGANILRSGLVAAIAALERLGARGQTVETVLRQLATASIPGLDGVTAQDLPDRVRRLERDDYMLATREILAIATWLKRAVQATFGD